MMGGNSSSCRVKEDGKYDERNILCLWHSVNVPEIQPSSPSAAEARIKDEGMERFPFSFQFPRVLLTTNVSTADSTGVLQRLTIHRACACATPTLLSPRGCGQLSDCLPGLLPPAYYIKIIVQNSWFSAS